MAQRSIFYKRVRVGPAAAAAFLLTAGLFVAGPAQGARLTNQIEFSTILPRQGSTEWIEDRDRDAQRQESYRKHVAIPDAVTPFVSRDARISLINGQKFALPVHPAPNYAVSRFFNVLFFTVVLGLVGGLFARKFAPHVLVDLNQRFNPWAAPLPVVQRNSPAYVRDEEPPFGEFVAAFRAGPAATPVAVADPAAKPAGSPLREFYTQARKRLTAQQRKVQEVIGESNDVARRRLLINLHFDLGVLKDSAVLPELLPIWQLASAVEGLLKELSGKVRNATPSTLRTVQGGLEALKNLCTPELKPDLLSARPLRFLVVDDEIISRQALSLSLKKAFSEPDLAVDGASALVVTAKQAYDVIFLDVQMPGMDGFELCQKIHNTELNRYTPVVFVTGHGDFDARVKSTLIGGNDLLGKPFLIFEITVKALALALQGRMHTVSQPAAAQPASQPGSTPAASSLPGAAARPHFPNAALTINRRPATPATSTETGGVLQAFLNRAAENLGPLRELCGTLAQIEDVTHRQNVLADGFLRLNSLLAKEEIVHPAYQLTQSLNALVRKLLQDASLSTPSALATIATAVDLLNELCLPGLDADLATNPPIRLLVVDDDLVARRTLTVALQNAFQKPECVESGEMALALTQDNQFDVIFLDLQMPGMDGFETCVKIHQTGINSDTPIVFVTGQSDYAARVESSRSGGHDLVTKPFFTAEINLKALTYALRSRLKRPVLEAGEAVTTCVA